ncbi:hypothetical protein AVEN_41235-1 [Araneus ventricosus]|uniref:Transposase Tc1-like domain-containing protein n=1 Tax=Araneus ventricosus TaxID=182803 RepID=A0A4Y2J759_ARAVE|nr:hypothetical protein AVEN_41235-1 [Araneus ventricosus]
MWTESAQTNILVGLALEQFFVKKSMYRNRWITRASPADFNDGASTSVSVRTVQPTVNNMGSQSRRPTRVPLLTARHKALLLSWARQHYHWSVDDWKHVAWSDESRPQLYRTDARVPVWRRHH